MGERATKSFGALWVIQVSSATVLQNLGYVCNQLINYLAYYCGGRKKYFRPRGLSIAEVSATVAPAVPTPLTVEQKNRC